MKAAVLHEYDPAMKIQLKVETVPEPTIQAHDEVIVRIGAAGLCRTDLHIIEGVLQEEMDPMEPYCLTFWAMKMPGGLRRLAAALPRSNRVMPSFATPSGVAGFVWAAAVAKICIVSGGSFPG